MANSVYMTVDVLVVDSCVHPEPACDDGDVSEGGIKILSKSEADACEIRKT